MLVYQRAIGARRQAIRQPYLSWQTPEKLPWCWNFHLSVTSSSFRPWFWLDIFRETDTTIPYNPIQSHTIPYNPIQSQISQACHSHFLLCSAASAFCLEDHPSPILQRGQIQKPPGACWTDILEAAEAREFQYSNPIEPSFLHRTSWMFIPYSAHMGETRFISLD